MALPPTPPPPSNRTASNGEPPPRPPRRLPLPVLAGLLLAGAAVLLIAGLFLRATRELSRTSGRVAHTLSIIHDVDHLLSLLKDAETGQRGYLLVHDTHYLVPYEEARLRIGPSLERLRTLTADNPHQQQRLAHMAALIHRKLAELERTLTLDRNGQGTAALETVRSGEGQRLMDELRALGREFRAEEERLLSERSARLERASRSADTLVLAGSGFLLAFIGFVTLTFLRDFRLRERAAAEREELMAREQAVRVQEEAERQRVRLQAILAQVPAAMGVYRAPDQVCELANPALLRLHGNRPLVGRTVREAHPEHANSRLFGVFDDVFRTGQPYAATEHRLAMGQDGSGGYFNFTYQPLLDARGQVEAVLLFAVEVTEQVQARHAVEAALADRQRAEVALRESEARLHRILEAAEVGAWESDLRTRRVVGSPNIGPLIGLPPGDFDLTGDDCLALLHPEDREQVKHTLREAVRTRSEYRVHYRVLSPEGAVRWQECRGRVVLDEAGQPTKMVGVVLDITRQKHAEQLRQETEAQFQLLAETLPQLIWRTRADGFSDYFNQRWYDYTGRTLEQCQGEGWSQSLHPEDLERVLEAWRRAIATGEAYVTEYRLRRGSDGAYRWFIARGLPLRDGQGRITHWFGTCTDIDDQKRATQTLGFLSEASAALTASLDHAATLQQVARLSVPAVADWCLVDLMGEEGRIERVEVAHANPALTGLAERARRFPPGDNTEHLSTRALRSGKTFLARELPPELLAHSACSEEHLRVMLEMKALSLMSVPLIARGRTLGVLTFITTETSGRRLGERDVLLAEEVARRAAMALDNARLFSLAQEERKRAEEANLLKDDFLATVSHELRTPLTAMLGWVKLLRGGRLSADKREKALETVDRNAQAQAQLIEDLLDVSRIITGKLRLDTQPVHLADIIHAALESVRPAADAKAIHLLPELDPEGDLVVGDAGRLQQVVWNLLSNAVKFSPGGSRVRVLLRRVHASIEVTVTDEGPGIPADFLPHVFERFRQLEGGTTRRHGGLGLGLAIVRHLVELHGGTVYAASEGPGRGATFTVRLPSASHRPEGAETAFPRRRSPLPPLRLPAPPALARRNILVVDDERDNREVLRLLLEECGARVTTVSSAAEALLALREERPDVLVSDIGMPGEDGYSLIAQVRALSAEQGGKVPAVALTAYARVEDRTRALSSGFDMHLAKPVDPAELLTLLSNLMSTSPRS